MENICSPIFFVYRIEVANKSCEVFLLIFEILKFTWKYFKMHVSCGSFFILFYVVGGIRSCSIYFFNHCPFLHFENDVHWKFMQEKDVYKLLQGAQGTHLWMWNFNYNTSVDLLSLIKSTTKWDASKYCEQLHSRDLWIELEQCGRKVKGDSRGLVN